MLLMFFYPYMFINFFFINKQIILILVFLRNFYHTHIHQLINFQIKDQFMIHQFLFIQIINHYFILEYVL